MKIDIVTLCDAFLNCHTFGARDAHTQLKAR